MELASVSVNAEPVLALSGTVDRRDRLRRVFEVCADGLYRFILVRVGGHRHAADDLLQQVCEVAAGHRRVPEADDEVERWLFGVARKLIQKHWRSLKRRAGHLPIHDAVISADVARLMEDGKMPAEKMVEQEVADELMLAVTSLPAREQQLLFAYYFDGRSQIEIARDLGMTPKSIETKLYRLRSRLRAMLQDGTGKD